MIGLVVSLAFVIWFFLLARRQGKNPWAWAVAGFLSYSLPVLAWAFLLKAVLPSLSIRIESEAGAIALGLAIGLSAVAIGTISAVLVRRYFLAERPRAEGPATVRGGESGETLSEDEEASLDLPELETIAASGLSGAASELTGPADAGTRTPRTVTVPTLVAASSLSLLIGVLGGLAIGGFWSGGSRSVSGEAPSPDLKGGAVGPEITSAAPARDPQTAGDWTRLGDRFFDVGQYEEAITAYRRSLELGPPNANVLTDLAIAYRRTGRPEVAIGLFDFATQADPRHELARLNKGIVLLQDLEDPSGALEAFEGVLEINPRVLTADGRPLAELVESLRGNLEAVGEP